MNEEIVTQKGKCIDCGKDFERKLPKSKMERAKREMGAMIDACNDCLRN